MFEIILGLLALTNAKEISEFFVNFYYKIFFDKKIFSREKKEKIELFRKILYIFIKILTFITGIAIMYIIFVKSNYSEYDLYILIRKLGISFIIFILVYFDSDKIFRFLNNLFSKSIFLEIFKIYTNINYGKLLIGIFILNIILIISSVINF